MSRLRLHGGRYAPGMDPTVVAAAIGVGGTVVVGVAGYWASVRNTSKTIADAHESRVWDRRAKVYAEAIAAVEYMRLAGGFPPEDRLGRLGPTWSAAQYSEPSWDKLEARIRSYASQHVLDAMLASTAAHSRFGPPAAGPPLPAALDPPSAGVPAGALPDLMREAQEADEILIGLIRNELQGRYQAASRQSQRYLRYLQSRHKGPPY